VRIIGHFELISEIKWATAVHSFLELIQ
jgi:hypothetical protein